MVDQGIAAIVGVIVGSLLSTISPATQWWIKRKSLTAVIRNEICRSIDTIEKRMRWLERTPPEDTIKNNPEFLVEVDGRNLLLRESESIELPLAFWNKHCIELTGVVSEERFSAFFKTADLIVQFEAKDTDMIKAFQNNNINQAKEMAAACFRDLEKIQGKLKDLRQGCPTAKIRVREQ